MHTLALDTLRSLFGSATLTAKGLPHEFSKSYVWSLEDRRGPTGSRSVVDQ